MFVSESNIFNPSSLKIRISSMEGVDLVLDVSPDFTVDKLKMIAVSHFYDRSDSAKTSLYHKVLQTGTGKLLSEKNTLAQEGVRENDELLLLKKRIPPPPILDTSVSTKQKSITKDNPTVDDIRKATDDVAPVNLERKPDEPTTVDFQVELRRILISLIDAAQKLLCLNPEAAKIFKEAEGLLNEQKSGVPKIDKSALQQLKDMGFPETRATKALIINRMSTMEAMEWLLQHEEDDDIDDPIPGMPSYEQEDVIGATGGEPQCLQGASGTDLTNQHMEPKRIASILESFRAYRRREFRPNRRAVQNLMEMGFDEKDVMDALRFTGNREDEACEWLLSGKKCVAEEDLDQGLDQDGPIYTAIMANPVVQLGLSNPRSLLAFLHILENPSNTQQWLSDPETGPMLIQISRIYSAEKHAPKS